MPLLATNFWTQNAVALQVRLREHQGLSDWHKLSFLEPLGVQVAQTGPDLLTAVLCCGSCAVAELFPDLQTSAELPCQHAEPQPEAGAVANLPFKRHASLLGVFLYSSLRR